MFPVLKYSLEPKKDLCCGHFYTSTVVLFIKFTSNSPAIPGLPAKIQPMRSGLNLSFRPYKPPTADAELAALDKFHSSVSGESPIVFSSTMQKRIDAAKSKVSRRIEQRNFPVTEGADVGVIPLGTGGSIPSKYRNGTCGLNVSATD